MKDVIFLVATRRGIAKMTKSLPQLRGDEIPVKLTVMIPESAFRTPVIEKTVEVGDWRSGTDLADVEFRQDIITEQEAALIRSRRLGRMREILEEQGYEVKPPEPEDGNG